MWWCIWATGSTRKGSTNHAHWQKRNGSWFCARIFAPIRRPCIYPPTHAKSILRSSAGSDWIISLCRFVCRESNSLSATVQNGKSFNAFTKTALVPEYVRLYTLRAVPPTRHIFFTISLMSLASMRLSTDPANFSPAKSNKTKKTIFTTEIAINSLQMNRSNSTIPWLLDESFFESLGFWVLF